MKALAFSISIVPVGLLLIAGVLTGFGWLYLAALIACGLPIAIIWKGEEP